MRVYAQQAWARAHMSEQNTGSPGVFGGDCWDATQHLASASGQVPEIAEWSRDDEESAGAHQVTVQGIRS